MCEVSIIMPAYNAEKYIGEGIASVINQSYKNWELIVIDDGSTDNTAIIVKQLADTEKRISYHYQANAKQGKARNAGIEISKGKLIAFLDSDDLWLPDKLSLMMEEFEKAHQDLLFTDAYIFEGSFDPENVPDNQERFLVPTAQYQGAEGLWNFLCFNKIPMLTTLIKKEVLVEANMFSNRGICEDYELWLRLLIKGFTFRSVNLPLAAYRLHDQATTRNDKLAIDGCIDVIFNAAKQPENVNYKSLLLRGLINWYTRKLDTIFTRADLYSFLKKIRAQLGWHINFTIVALFNFKLFLNINKKLIRFSLKHQIDFHYNPLL